MLAMIWEQVLDNEEARCSKKIQGRIRSYTTIDHPTHLNPRKLSQKPSCSLSSSESHFRVVGDVRMPIWALTWGLRNPLSAILGKGVGISV